MCIGTVKSGDPASYVELLSHLEVMRDATEVRQGDPLEPSDQPAPTYRRRGDFLSSGQHNGDRPFDIRVYSPLRAARLSCLCELVPLHREATTIAGREEHTAFRRTTRRGGGGCPTARQLAREIELELRHEELLVDIHRGVTAQDQCRAIGDRRVDVKHPHGSERVELGPWVQGSGLSLQAAGEEGTCASMRCSSR
jgi:hypothetical protein